MKNTPENDEMQIEAAATLDVARFLFKDPKFGWRLLPFQQGMLAYQGRLTLPQCAGFLIKVAHVHYTCTRGEPLEFTRLDVDEWLIDANGLVDQGVARKKLLEKLNGGDRAVADVAISDADLISIKRCLPEYSG